MKQKIRNTVSVFSLLGLVVASLMLLLSPVSTQAQSYATGTASLSSGKYTYAVGETFSVTARLNVSVTSMKGVMGFITVSDNLTIVGVTPGAGFGAYIENAKRMNFNGYIYPTSPNPVIPVTLTVRADAVGNGVLQYPYLIVQDASMTRQSLSVSIVQPTCPAGQIGTYPNCSYPPVDVCPNIAGTQTSVPPGMIKDGSGNCVNIVSPTPPPPAPAPTPTPVDVCPNIAGTQTSVPPGMIKDGSGNCVNRPTTQQPRTITNPNDTQQSTSESNPQDVPAEIRDLSVQTSYRSAEIRFLATGNTSVNVQYGSQNNIDKTAEVTNDGESYTAKIAGLEPYTLYQYKISGVIDGKDVEYQGKFTTRGLPVRILITKGGSPVPNAIFYIDGVKLQTGEDGAALVELGIREYTVSVEDGSATSDHTINVSGDVLSENDSEAEQQSFELRLAETAGLGIIGLPNWVWLAIAGFIGALMIGAIAFALIKRRQNRQTDNGMITPLVVTPMPTDLPDETTTATSETALAQEHIATAQDNSGPTAENATDDGNYTTAENSLAPVSLLPEEQPTAPSSPDAPEGELLVHEPPMPPAEPQTDQDSYAQQPVSNQDKSLTPFTPGGMSLNPWGDSQPSAPIAPDNQDAATAAPVEPQIAPLPEQNTAQDNDYDTAARPRHTSVYIDDELPEDMFEAAKHSRQQ